MDSLSRCFSKVDFLSPKYRITYNFNSASRTCFNGLLTLIIAVVSLIFITLFGKELFVREVPTISLSKEQQEFAEVKLYDNPIIFSFNDLALNYLNDDETFMNNIIITVHSVSVVYEENTMKFEGFGLTFEKCSPTIMSDRAWQSYNSLISIENVFCVNPFRKIDRTGKIIEEDIVVRNPYAQAGSVGVRISVSLCSDESEECKLVKETIKTGIWFGFVVIDNYIEPKDFKNPIRYRVKTEPISIRSDFYRSVSLEHEITKLLDDKGLLFEDIVEESYVNMVKGETRYNSKDAVNPLLTLEYSTRNLVEKVNRRYLKAQEFFADIGGFLKVIIMAGRALAVVSSKYAFYRSNFSEANRENTPFVNNLMETSKHQKINASQINLAKKQKAIRKGGFLQFVKGLFSSRIARQFGMEQTVLYKYFDAKTLQNSILNLEKKLKEVNIILNPLK